MIVTRYVRDDGRVIVHVYGGEDGFYPTRSKAQTAKERMIREQRLRSDEAANPDWSDKTEFTCTKVIAL